MPQQNLSAANEAYRRQKILTASPIELIVLLYDGLHKDIAIAQLSISKGQNETAHKKLINAQAIVTELINSLNLDFAIAQDLLPLYEFLLRSLIEVNSSKDAKVLPDLLEIVDDLRATWVDVADSTRKAIPISELKKAGEHSLMSAFQAA
ncbi:MAG: flagellar export chaperone FliS [Oscillospiraceae bacterium]|jgi:flagellar protein FliS|nr:flagellar export chaperone FliS [Oscillospiraceae bacterium]